MGRRAVFVGAVLALAALRCGAFTSAESSDAADAGGGEAGAPNGGEGDGATVSPDTDASSAEGGASPPIDTTIDGGVCVPSAVPCGGKPWVSTTFEDGGLPSFFTLVDPKGKISVSKDAYASPFDSLLVTAAETQGSSPRGSPGYVYVDAPSGHDTLCIDFCVLLHPTSTGAWQDHGFVNFFDVSTFAQGATAASGNVDLGAFGQDLWYLSWGPGDEQAKTLASAFDHWTRVKLELDFAGGNLTVGLDNEPSSQLVTFGDHTGVTMSFAADSGKGSPAMSVFFDDLTATLGN